MIANLQKLKPKFDLSLGRIYLVKGPPAQLYWLIKDFPNIQFLWKPTVEQLYSIISFTDFDQSETNFVVVPNSFNIPDNLFPAPDVRVFILLQSIPGDLPEKAQKVYDSYNTLPYVSLDVRQVVQYEPKVEGDTQAVIEDLGQNPWRLNWQLEQPDPKAYELEEFSDADVLQLITSLGQPASIGLWSRLSRSAYYRLGFMPEIERSVLYKFLVGTGGKKETYGMCPALWSYYEILYVAWYERFIYNPAPFFKLFASWVALASTIWATSQEQGFNSYVSRKNNRTYYSFQPSSEAISAFNSLLNPYLCLEP